MKKAWKIVLTVSFSALALGLMLFGLSVLMDADLIRIADVVFSKYDLTAIYLNVENAITQAKAMFGM